MNSACCSIAIDVTQFALPAFALYAGYYYTGTVVSALSGNVHVVTWLQLLPPIGYYSTARAAQVYCVVLCGWTSKCSARNPVYVIHYTGRVALQALPLSDVIDFYSPLPAK